MLKSLVLRGAGAGALAGLITFLYARIFAEPLVQASIDYEGARSEALHAIAMAAGHHPETEEGEVFSRAFQMNVGLGVGLILFGVAVGVFYAVAYGLAWGRTGRQSPRSLALLVALGGFVTLFLVPFLKYPTNPPAVGHHETISARTGLYLIMVLGAVAFALASIWLGRRLAERLGNWNASVVGVACFVVLCGLLMAVLPALGHLQANVEVYGNLPTETPQPVKDARGTLVLPGFDADLLYNFRLQAVLSSALLWTVLAVAFAPLAERVLRTDDRAVTTAAS